MSDRITFEDGAAYERGMGGWSRLAGEVFLEWLAPAPGLAWIDIGCGNGAFTELLTACCAPARVLGIDPSPAQLSYARARQGTAAARFEAGDAMALPASDAAFDAAVMALVLFFVPDPAKGIAEMRRVVRPGGIIAAYVWDMLDGGFPYHPIQAALRAEGKTPMLPPSAAVSRRPALEAAFRDGGLEAVESTVITVRRHFAGFDEFWESSAGTGALKPTIDRMPAEVITRLRAHAVGLLTEEPGGGVSFAARAHAVKARVPG